MKRLILALVMLAMAAPVWADAGATKMLNDMRASKGRKAVVYSQKLETAATAHVNDMTRNGFFSHTGSNRSSVGDRVKRAGYKWCFIAENIADGQKSLTGAMKAWAGSAPHRKNMLARKVQEFAIAHKGNRWVMVLAKPC